MNKIGRFGEYGGQYVPEIVMNAVNELNEAYETYKNGPEFLAQLRQLYRDYANRPSLLYYAEKMTKDLGGAKVYLKREDLNHTGAHKINNVLGQILLAKRWEKKESSQRQVQDSTELLQRLLQHYLTWNVLYIWEQKTWNARV